METKAIIIHIFTGTIAIGALIVSMRSCDIAQNANDIAMDNNKLFESNNRIAESSNEIAKNSISAMEEIAKISNELTQKGQTSEEKFASITAELVWSDLLDSYYDIDNQVKFWEESKKLNRDGPVIESSDSLIKIIKSLNPPDEILRLYIRRMDKYTSLKIAAQRYEPFENRMKNIDFALPAKPRSPRAGTIEYVPGAGTIEYVPGAGSIISDRKKKKASDDKDKEQ